jgi:hypothetical protein
MCKIYIPELAMHDIINVLMFKIANQKPKRIIMKFNRQLALSLLVITSFYAKAQIDADKLEKELLDSLYILEIEKATSVPKVLHAEPLYIDLIRDLGARKGENEWNVGVGMMDKKRYDEFTALIEYEWAPIDRLGLEVELPFSLYYPHNNGERIVGNDTLRPSSRLNSLKLAAQWSFYVSEKYSTTLALGYLHEFEMVDFNHYGRNRLHRGNIYNPFFIAAKRWADNFHTLVYAGPFIEQYFTTTGYHITQQINSNFHYMIPGTRNFVGIEINKEWEPGDFDMTIRPQMRVSLADNLMVGVVIGIPAFRESERFSSFIRLIYEPRHKHK